MDGESNNNDRPLCRRTRRGEERCERVRAVASELFLAHGYDRVSLDDIIAQAGGSKTNIYSHFGGKEGLFIATVERLCDQVNATLKALDLADASLEDGLRQLGRTLMMAVLDERHLGLYRLIIGQSGRIPGIGGPWMTHGPEETRRIIALFLTPHQNRLRDLTPERAAGIYHNMLIWDHLNSAVFAHGEKPESPVIDKHVDDTLSLFARGYILPA
ncbi:TetR/AcrR family transcriptional regulator [Telmatospirillum siberiense]|uniref:TetR/AcrR family transcriptional regulator n=1 Tax=Telmatospirillum siberiense TaxID=382514 RepID=A0A2N3PZP2_9PROT|nr:TetR/AcrR family transcriptional regulator [Telmatospirillum siberiense]PKU25876.1 TetR/AcrR family transcriptional regulator [Telmatospirillum siberiense]